MTEVCEQLSHCACVKIRGQLCRVGSLFSYVGPGELNSGHQPCLASAFYPLGHLTYPYFNFSTFYVAQAGFKLTVRLRMTLNSLFSCLRLPSAARTGTHHHIGDGNHSFEHTKQALCQLRQLRPQAQKPF